MDKSHIPLYTLNSFLKFDRKLYQVFGLPLGRPIAFKSIIYALVIGVIEIVIYFTPIIGKLISWIPVGILLVVPIGASWLLTDIGTEDRSPFSFFKSFFLYQIRRIKGDSIYRGRSVPKERDYSFNNYFFCTETAKNTPVEVLKEYDNAEQVRIKALRYMERMQNPDEFFARLKKEQEEKKRKRKWFFRRKR